MIVKMRHVTLLCTEKSRGEALEALQDLGLFHVSGRTADQSAPQDLADAEKALENAEKAATLLKSLDHAADGGATGDKATPEDILEAYARVQAAEGTLASLEREYARYAPFGDFDPAEASLLAGRGLPVTLYRARLGETPAAAQGVVLKISEDVAEKVEYGAIVGTPAEGAAFEEVPPPERRLSAIQAAIDAGRADLDGAKIALSAFAGRDAAIDAERQARKSVRDYFAAKAAMGDEGGIAWLEGFCPEETLDALRRAASEHGWGLSEREPTEDETPPTLLRPPRIFQPIVSLFDVLGILPGYREADVSVVFYSFFTIFFAMLVGDAGYGAVILALTVFAQLKFRKAPAAPFILLLVFSVATIAWGVLTNAYFGAHFAALNFASARWLNKEPYCNIMQLCFFLGATQLSVARLWNAVKLWPDTKALAEIGWTGIIWTMYCVACLVIVQGFQMPAFMYAVAPVSALLIFCFMLKKSELKTEGINLAILPLNIMSCLGDVISYVRLFAVGLAALKVSENFNSMALDLDLPPVVKIPAMIAILLVGHVLNFAMGALSILVHAVRLNTLEFSNHKGVSWSGFAYDPFRK